MRKQYLVFVFCSITFVNLFISCSSIPKSDFQNHYYSPDYENKSFKNVSMDICYPKTKFKYDSRFSGLDSNTVLMLIDFGTTFKKYFPEGIKMFSCATNTGWIFYEANIENPTIMYDKQSNKGTYLYSVFMPDSLSFFQKRSNSDFLLIIHYTMFAGNAISDDRYESTLTINYSFWNNIDSDLVVIDQVTTKMDFNKLKLGNRWPYRGVILKAASEIFERLPMFSK